MSYVVCRWALDEEEKFRILPFSNATFVRSRNQLRNNIEKENENEKKKSRIDVAIKSTLSITKSTSSTPED